MQNLISEKRSLLFMKDSSHAYGPFTELSVSQLYKSTNLHMAQNIIKHSINLPILKIMSACQGESKDIILNASSTLVRTKVCFIPVLKNILGRQYFLLSVHLCTLVSPGLIPFHIFIFYWVYLWFTVGPEILCGEAVHFCCSICLGFFLALIYY